MTKFIENRLIEEFKSREYFSREDLFEFYRSFEPDLEEGTLGWRIYDLKSRNVISPVKRGVYIIADKPPYTPELSPELVKIARQITSNFEDVNHCIWESGWLNEFTQQQATKRIILIEIERDFMKSLYYDLKDSNRREVFLNPDQTVIDLYVAESDCPIVIRNLISRSPTANRIDRKVEFDIPLLEKMLVDLFAEVNLFYYLQGPELVHIYTNAISNYAINFTTLFSYARRREREQDIKQFMMKHMSHLVKGLVE